MSTFKLIEVQYNDVKAHAPSTKVGDFTPEQVLKYLVARYPEREELQSQVSLWWEGTEPIEKVRTHLIFSAGNLKISGWASVQKKKPVKVRATAPVCSALA